MRSRLPLIAVAVVIVLCVVGVAIFAVAQGGSALAYEVNGTRVSQSTVNDQLDDLASTNATKTASHTDGSIDSTLTARLLNTNIVRDLHEEAADNRGIQLSGGDRSAGEAAARTSIGQNFNRLPSSYTKLVSDLYAWTNALGLKDDTAINSFLSKRIAKAHVYVNPKYGFWNPKYGVCPPTGCANLATNGGG
jgi:hypothetical protein